MICLSTASPSVTTPTEKSRLSAGEGTLAPLAEKIGQDSGSKNSVSLQVIPLRTCKRLEQKRTPMCTMLFALMTSPAQDMPQLKFAQKYCESIGCMPKHKRMLLVRTIRSLSIHPYAQRANCQYDSVYSWQPKNGPRLRLIAKKISGAQIMHAVYMTLETHIEKLSAGPPGSKASSLVSPKLTR